MGYMLIQMYFLSYEALLAQEGTLWFLNTTLLCCDLHISFRFKRMDAVRLISCVLPSANLVRQRQPVPKISQN